MGWLGWGKAEESKGDSEKVSDVKVNVKSNDSGKVTDILVSHGGNPHENHTHFFKTDKGQSGEHKKGGG